MHFSNTAVSSNQISYVCKQITAAILPQAVTTRVNTVFGVAQHTQATHKMKLLSSHQKKSLTIQVSGMNPKSLLFSTPKFLTLSWISDQQLILYVEQHISQTVKNDSIKANPVVIQASVDSRYPMVHVI